MKPTTIEINEPKVFEIPPVNELLRLVAKRVIQRLADHGSTPSPESRQATVSNRPRPKRT